MKHQTAVQITERPRESADPSQFISVVIPIFNEASIIIKHLTVLYQYLSELEVTDQYRWEIIVVDDGSTDGSAFLAKSFANTFENVRVIYHDKNYGLGKALRTGFNHAAGEWIICLDLDLTYSPDHIRTLLHARQGVQLVMTSPYMKGGKVTDVPWLRKWLSLIGNSILSFVNLGRISTFTSMVRLYDASFVRSLPLSSDGAEINLEILYKAMSAGAKVIEIPSHLNWQDRDRRARISWKRLIRQSCCVIQYSFLFIRRRNAVKLWRALNHG